jgi:hypothetical protein
MKVGEHRWGGFGEGSGRVQGGFGEGSRRVWGGFGEGSGSIWGAYGEGPGRVRTAVVAHSTEANTEHDGVRALARALGVL